MEFYNKDLNIIHPADYLEKIKSFSFIKLIEVKPDDSYIRAIEKDNYKDFFEYLVEMNIEPIWNMSLYDLFDDFGVAYDYFILDLMHLDDICGNTLFNFLLDFMDILDTSENKFKLLYDMYYSESQKYIVKVSRVNRNLGLYPIIEERINSLLGQIESYNYSSFDVYE